MSEDRMIFIAGTVTGLAGSLLVALFNQLLALRREKIAREAKRIEEKKQARRKLIYPDDPLRVDILALAIYSFVS